MLVDRSAPDPIHKRTLAGLKAARARGRVGPQAKDMARCFGFGVSFGTVYKQVGAAAPEK